MRKVNLGIAMFNFPLTIEHINAGRYGWAALSLTVAVLMLATA